MDTKKLRQKILDLAIHGKLVPQDPNDEPASVLLERIRAEKERLIKEGKIKRSRKTTKTSHATCDEQEVPFEVPSGWVWTSLYDITSIIGDGLHGTPQYNSQGFYYFINGNNLFNRKIVFKKDTKRLSRSEYEKYKKNLNDRTILVSINGTIGNIGTYNGENVVLGKSACYFNLYSHILKDFICYLIESNYFLKYALDSATGSTIKNVPLKAMNNFKIPLPPLAEQQRIVEEIERWFKLIDIVEQGKTDLQSTIKQAKNKILELAIHGKLVPQIPNDEPASELLKRINPKAEITCDNGHYPKLPKGWAMCRLEDIVEYEQPTAYIVKSTAYSDDYSTPVLTAGKSFIIGHTDETEGIYNNLPCIIFDDFTTASRLVDFPFKVKSSAMKILQVNKVIDIEYVSLFMSITRLVGDTHKRYWISEYSKLEIPIPPQKEQKRIIRKIHQLFKSLETIGENL